MLKANLREVIEENKLQALAHELLLLLSMQSRMLHLWLPATYWETKTLFYLTNHYTFLLFLLDVTSPLVATGGAISSRSATAFGRSFDFLCRSLASLEGCIIQHWTPSKTFLNSALSTFVPPAVSCITQAHEERVSAHLLLVEMYFVGPFALKYSLNFSSWGMPSTFNISAPIVYFLLHPEYNLISSLSYKWIQVYKLGFSAFFFLTHFLLREI